MLENQQGTPSQQPKAPTPEELIASTAARVTEADKKLVASLTGKDEERQLVDVAMTPTAAALILRDHNGNNRGFKPKAKLMARDMRNGHWELTGELLKFDVTGRLRDGQNRLLACVMADVDIRFGVVLGESVDAARRYDSGTARTAGDILAMGGAHDSTLREQIVKAAVNYEQRLKSGKSSALTRTEIVEHAERHSPTLTTAIGLARRSLEKPEGQSPSFEPCLKEKEAATFAFLALSGGWTAAEIGSFLSALQLGVGDGENHPIEQAASRLIDDLRNHKTRKPTMRVNQRLSLSFQSMQLVATNKRRRLTVPNPKSLTPFERPEGVPDDMLGDGMPLAAGSNRADH